MGYSRHFFSPSRTILISMGLTIIIGTFLLALPVARTCPISLIDLFFTSTSCTCVTGLLTVPLSSFSLFGKMVIMILMQIGGLGLVTLTFFIASLFLNLGLSSQVIAGEMLDLDSWKQTKQILLFIIGLTFFIETVCAFFLFQTFKEHYPFFKALFYSFFHAVSSFCNAGISIFPVGMTHYAENYNMLIVTTILMISGSIGFITWHELFTKLNPFRKKRSFFSVQTKIILSYYFLFCVGGMIIFWLLERNNTLEAFDGPLQWLNALFISISSRNCGYLTVYPDDMQYASIFTIIVNSFIGSAPGSTGSGIKLTTTAIFVATISAAIANKGSVHLHGRSVARDQVYKALALVSLSILWVALTIFCLLITENSWPFLDIVFESFSAFATLGASIGMTPFLSVTGKLLLCLSMFAGRVGSLTLLIALRKKSDGGGEFSYPEERIMIT